MSRAARHVGRMAAAGTHRRERCVHDRGYEPLWSYLEEADRPFALHPGLNGLVPSDELRHRFDDDYGAMHAVHFPMEQMMGLTDLICFGVLDRHPRLRVAFLETGAVWALHTSIASTNTSSSSAFLNDPRRSRRISSVARAS